jgi:hypothetical protein
MGANNSRVIFGREAEARRPFTLSITHDVLSDFENFNCILIQGSVQQRE